MIRVPNYEKTICRRIEGITADIFRIKGTELFSGNTNIKETRAYINYEHGVDDLLINSPAEYPAEELPYYSQMSYEQKESFNEIAKAAISKSKYKEALVKQTPGVEMEDIEKNMNRD